MRGEPKNRKEAEAYQYGGYNNPYNPERCAAVSCDKSNPRWPRWHQCLRKPGHGPDEAFCKQHAEQISPEDEIHAWVVSGYLHKLEPVILSKITEKSVWIKGIRTARSDGYARYFETKEDAINYLKNLHQNKIKKAKATILESEASLKELEKQ